VPFETSPSSLARIIELSAEERPILVATGGRPNADTAMIAAAFLAGRNREAVHVFSVVENVLVPCRTCHQAAETAAAQGHTAEVCKARRAVQNELILRRTAVETQIGLTVGETARWPIQVHAGTLSDITRSVVADTRAQVLVIGQSRQRSLVSPPGECAPTEQLTHTSIPVYIAAPTLRGLARRVVVAMDFSEISVRAAQLAMRCSAADASVYLIHVLPHAAVSELETRRHQLQHVARILQTETDFHVEPVLLLGAAAPETLGFAGGIGADLIACGAYSPPAYPTTRPVPPALGRVARELIRRVPCSLLIAPEMAVE